MMRTATLQRTILVSCLLIAAALISSCRYDAASSPVAPSDPASRAEQAANAAAVLGRDLKAKLVASMQAEGPVAAIDVCTIDAPAIAARVSAEAGLDVGRTSLRVRNPANRPDDREREVLERWSEALAAGATAEDLTVHVEEGNAFLWMKPIVTEGPCLTCHGQVIPDEVAAALAARYPEDQATGYTLGELRGAFVVREE